MREEHDTHDYERDAGPDGLRDGTNLKRCIRGSGMDLSAEMRERSFSELITTITTTTTTRYYYYFRIKNAFNYVKWGGLLWALLHWSTEVAPEDNYYLLNHTQLYEAMEGERNETVWLE